MRDLQKAGTTAPANGDTPQVDLSNWDDTAVPALTAAELRREVRTVKRDKKIAEIAVLVLDTTKLLEPVVAMISERLLRWVALGAAVALAFRVLQDPTYESLAVLGIYMLLAPLLLRLGR